MSFRLRPPPPPPTPTFSSTYTLKPRCTVNITTQTSKPTNNYNLHLSSDTTTPQEPTAHTNNKMINLEDHHHFPSFHPSQSSSPFSIRTFNNKLGKRWKEYQGMRDWEGMLDPLDENLRAEILRYGEFVEAAYKSLELDSCSGKYGTCRFPKSTLLERCGLGKTGYKVTKHLRASSGIQLPDWVHKQAPTWVATQSSYVGYVAVCDNKDQINRLGRRDVVVAFRGTATFFEWLHNFRANLTHIPCNTKTDPFDNNSNNNNNNNNDDNDMLDGGTSSSSGAMVESGFLSLYTSSITDDPSSMSLQEMLRQEIGRILQMYEGEPLSLTITGHSLGAALATLVAYDVNTLFPRPPLVTVISFGGPRVGDRMFRRQLEEQGTKVLRIVNSDDVITKVPGFVFDDDEDDDSDDDDVAKGGDVHVAGLPRWIQKRVEEAQLGYAEVGRELRLSSKDSPYIGNRNVATCHELNTYLHLVDGFVSSTCPFRATDKRFLRR